MSAIIYRITDNGQYTNQELINFFNKHTNFKAVEEYKSYNPSVGKHYHGWFEGELSKKTLIHYITTELHCKGNEDYSISQKEVKQYDSIEGYKYYTCKGEKLGEVPTVFYNLDQQAVSEYHKNYYLEQEKRKTVSKDKSSKHLKQLTAYVIKELEEIYNNQPHQIPYIILDWYDNNDKIISDFQCENFTHYIRTKVDKDYKRTRADKIQNKIMRFN